MIETWLNDNFANTEIYDKLEKINILKSKLIQLEKYIKTVDFFCYS